MTAKQYSVLDPRYRAFPMQVRINHYYGDAARQLLFGAAGVMLFGAPFYASDFAIQMPFIVIAGFVYIALAALINPHKHLVMGAAAAAAGAGVVIYELWALWYYDAAAPVDFVLRQIIALLLMAAFYFSLKTFRSMIMGMIGKPIEDDEFQPDATVEVEAPREVYETEEDGARDALGRPAAPEVDKGGD
jgi:hypothetical protein